MKKILPYVTNNNITMNCWHHWFTSALLGNRIYEPWYVENFISHTLGIGFGLGYQYSSSLEHLSYYDEVIEKREIFDKNNILDTVKQAINNNNYVNLFWDHFYVKGSETYNKEFHRHTGFIIGYDDIERVIYFSDVRINNITWGVHTLDYDLFEKAFYSTLKQVRDSENLNIDDHYRYYTPAFTIHLRPFSRPVDLYKLYTSFRLHKQGNEAIRKTMIIPDWLKSFHNKTRTEYSGMSIYKGFYNDLYNTVLEYVDINGNINTLQQPVRGLLAKTMRFFVEVKKSLIYRIKYLKDNNIIPISDELICKANNLGTSSERFSGLLIKYLATSNISELERWRIECIRMEELESEIIGILLENLYKRIRERV